MTTTAGLETIQRAAGMIDQLRRRPPETSADRGRELKAVRRDMMDNRGGVARVHDDELELAWSGGFHWSSGNYERMQDAHPAIVSVLSGSEASGFLVPRAPSLITGCHRINLRGLRIERGVEGAAMSATGTPVELARYRISQGERIVRGQRVLGVVPVTDAPLTATAVTTSSSAS